VFLALGQIGWTTIVREAIGRKWLARPAPRFGHEALVPLSNERWLLGSYHPSQQNTFTGKLTEPMLDAVMNTAKRLLTTDQPA
jgi:uracil-DNA glycosylase